MKITTKAEVSISRVVSNGRTSYVVISLHTPQGSVRVELSLEDYARVTTGLMVTDVPAAVYLPSTTAGGS